MPINGGEEGLAVVVCVGSEVGGLAFGGEDGREGRCNGYVVVM